MAMVGASQQYQVYDSATKRIQSFNVKQNHLGDIDEREEGKQRVDPCLEVSLLSLEHRSAIVVMVGHSFLRRAQDFMNNNHGYYNNLNISHHICQVFWEVRGGMRADELYNDYLSSVMAHRPDVVYIEAGSNDLCNPDLVPANPAHDIMNFAEALHNLGVPMVMIGQCLFRVGTGIPLAVQNFNQRVVLMNALLSAFYDGDQFT